MIYEVYLNGSDDFLYLDHLAESIVSDDVVKPLKKNVP